MNFYRAAARFIGLPGDPAELFQSVMRLVIFVGGLYALWWPVSTGEIRAGSLAYVLMVVVGMAIGMWMFWGPPDPPARPKSGIGLDV